MEKEFCVLLVQAEVALAQLTEWYPAEGFIRGGIFCNGNRVVIRFVVMKYRYLRRTVQADLLVRWPAGTTLFLCSISNRETSSRSTLSPLLRQPVTPREIMKLAAKDRDQGPNDWPTLLAMTRP